MTQNERVKEIRKTLGLTLEKFGERIGVTRGSMSNIENGNRNLTEQMTKSICREFSVDYMWLTTGEGEMFIDTDDDFIERIDRIIVNISGDKIKSIVKDATIAINKNRPVSEADITKVIEKGINKINVDEHELIHCLPTSYRLDMGDEIKDPRNIFGESLSVDILLGLVPEIQYRNLSTVIENAHLETAEKAFSAYASGLSCLVEDEKEIGASGKMNFKPIFDQMYANNIKDWYVEVEQYTQNDPVASVQQSYDYLNKADYVK